LGEKMPDRNPTLYFNPEKYLLFYDEFSHTLLSIYYPRILSNILSYIFLLGESISGPS
jgi:hypothetical protein